MTIFDLADKYVFIIYYSRSQEEYEHEYSECFFINKILIVNKDPRFNGIFCKDHKGNLVFINKYEFADSYIPDDIEMCTSSFRMHQYIENIMQADAFNRNSDSVVNMLYFVNEKNAENVYDNMNHNLDEYCKMVHEYQEEKNKYDKQNYFNNQEAIKKGAIDILGYSIDNLYDTIDYIRTYAGNIISIDELKDRIATDIDKKLNKLQS